MKSTILIILFFAIGLLGGVLNWWPQWLLDDQLSMYALYALIFLVGLSIGSDQGAMSVLRRINPKIIFIPLAIIIGSLGGAWLVAWMFGVLNTADSLAIGAGFGYYSLSSILIAEVSSPEAGVIALLSNVMREISTFILAPILIPIFGKLTPIAIGGATAMDTTLPVAVKYSGKEYGVFALFTGIVLSMLVPVIISFIYQYL